MNIDHSPLLKQSNHFRSNRSLPLDPQKLETHAYLRFEKTDSVSSRSPFSKLTNTGTASERPVQRLKAHGQSHAGNFGGILGGVPARSTVSKFGRWSASVGSTSPNCNGPPANQARHSAKVPAAASRLIDSTKSDTLFCNIERGDFGEEISEDIVMYSYDSSVVSQPFHRSVKIETDLFPAERLSHSGASPASEDQNFPVLVTEKSSGHTANPSDVPRSRNNTNQADPTFLSRSPRIQGRGSVKRESSVAPPIRDQPGEDLSILLFKGAKDLRNTSMALEEKTRALEYLKEELRVVTSEKDDLSKQLTFVKSRAKDRLESHAKKLEKMKEDLLSLIGQSQEFFALARQAKASMADITELKDVVQKSTDKLATLADQNGVYAPTQAWKSVLSEIRTEILSKQRVIDMLRDRLELAQGDLAESKNRIMELEGSQAHDSRALQSSAQQLGDSGRKIIELVSLLKDQQRENTVILTRNIEFENELNALTKQNIELQNQISSKEVELTSLGKLRTEHESLCRLLVDKDEQIRVLNGDKERVVRAEEQLKDREMELGLLSVSTETKDNAIESLKKSLLLAEIGVANQTSLVQSLKTDLDFNRAQLKLEQEAKAKLLDEKMAMTVREEALVSEANKFKNDLEEIKIELHQTHTRYEMLQERFEEQAVMLRMEKKAHGDVQERLLSADTIFSETVEKLTRNSEFQADESKAQIKKLEDMLVDRQEELSAKTQEYTGTLSGIEIKHAESIRKLEMKLVAKSEEVKMSNKEAGELREDAASLRRQLENLRSDCGRLQSELSQARRPSEAHTEEMEQMKRDIEHLRKSNEDQTYRANSILKRYEKGDLSTEEKKLVDAAHKACQTAHEQQLVVTGNEIRKRDNLIKSLEKSKSDLESQLARVLNTQASTKATKPAAEGGRSLIDLDGWVSSQASTSPISKKGPFSGRGGGRPPVTGEMNSGNFTAKEQATSAATTYRNTTSPPGTMSFAKVSGQAIDLLDKDDVFNENAAIANVTAAKRKRTPDTTIAERPEIPGPLRRSTRTRSKTTNDSEDPAHAPKVKARKRR